MAVCHHNTEDAVSRYGDAAQSGIWRQVHSVHFCRYWGVPEIDELLGVVQPVGM